MARWTLAVAGVVWLLVGTAGVALALTGAERVLSLLPPLAIDADALGGAVTTIAIALIAIGGAHLAILLGLRGARRWPRSAGALLTGVLAVASLALGAAAVSSAVRHAEFALPLLGGASVATLAAAAYGGAAAGLVRELRAGSVS